MPGSSCVDLALVDVQRKFDDAMIPFILNDDQAAGATNTFEGFACSDLSPSSRRFLYCLNLVGQFRALLINYGQLTTANMKVVARHLKRPPGGSRRNAAP